MNGELRRRLGSVRLDADRPEEARRHLETLIARRPVDAEARLGLVRAYRALGDSAQADRELMRCARSIPRLPSGRSDVDRANHRSL